MGWFYYPPIFPPKQGCFFTIGPCDWILWSPPEAESMQDWPERIDIGRSKRYGTDCEPSLSESNGLVYIAKHNLTSDCEGDVRVNPISSPLFRFDAESNVDVLSYRARVTLIPTFFRDTSTNNNTSRPGT